MRNRYGVVLLLLFLLQHGKTVFGQRKDKIVILNGVVKHFNNQIQLEDMSELADLELPNSNRMFTPDSANQFSFSFKLDQPGYFRFGRNILYLSPGDSMYMNIDRDWTDSATFEGIGSEANNYLKGTPFPKSGSFLQGGLNIKTTIQETINVILSLADKRKHLLDAYKTVPNNFRILEQARITADIINSLVMFQFCFPYSHHIPNDSLETFNKKYIDTVKPYINTYAKQLGVHPSYLQLRVYRDILPSILPENTTNTMVRDWIKASDVVEEFKMIKEKKSILLFQKDIDSITTARYKTTVIKTFNKLMEFRNGDAAIDLEMLDTANKPVALHAFKGKVIYIDLWATWCGPCMEELPFIDTLRTRYKDNNGIVFISLSIDDNKEEWLKLLEKRNSWSNEYIIDRTNLEAYNVTAIPRSIIINQQFKIEALEGDLPSSNNTIPVLDKLLMP